MLVFSFSQLLFSSLYVAHFLLSLELRLAIYDVPILNLDSLFSTCFLSNTN